MIPGQVSTIWAQLSLPYSPAGSIPFVLSDGYTIATDVLNYSYNADGNQRVYLANKITFAYTATATSGGGATAVVNNSPTGRVIMSAGNSSLTVTNSQCTATSIVIINVESNDATATIKKSVIPANGSFTITMNANCTSAVTFSFVIVNI